MFSPYSHSGFFNAPVSKGFLGTVVVASFALNVPFQNYCRHLFLYSYAGIFEKFEIWRIITSKVAFLDTKDLICGTLLIYYFRIFERKYGSTKFASYLIATCTLSTALELLAKTACEYITLNIGDLPSGPYGFIFPLFVPYFCDIPRVAMTHILGIPVTGKSFMYILGLQIASTSPESIIVGVCGILSGLLYRLDLGKIQGWFKVPTRLANVAAKTLGWLLRSPPPMNQSGMGATLEIQRQQQMERMEQQLARARQRDFRNRGIQIGRPQPMNPEIFANNFQNHIRELRNRQPPPADPVPGPSGLQATPAAVPEEQVTRLTEMGFERDNALQALRATNNDINLAMNILLQDSAS
ncbi:ubiquitin-associated domain-containing protein 2-like [Lineus longissimus]|uniref:ubiquitin-associated domain-containing protein 2-like n=1 Tax=Lineus longissimus TaxID=88925 RepID=UPI002B4CD103